MMMYKLIALAFVLLTPIFANIITQIFRLERFGLKFPDLSLPLFLWEIVIVSDKFFTHSWLPYYLIVMSLLAMILAVFLLKRSKHFSYKRFGKLFWRIGFILTFIFYLVLLAFIMTT